MQVEADKFDLMIARLRKLPNTDRKAVLARMSIEQRYAVEQVLDASSNVSKDQVALNTPTGKQFSIYSPALANMLTAITAGEQPVTPGGTALTRATCDAMRDVAEDIRKQEEKNKTPQPPSVLDGFRALLFGTGAKP